MLRLDSSEMLPGSQKGEEAAQILNTELLFPLICRMKFTQRNNNKLIRVAISALPCILFLKKSCIIYVRSDEYQVIHKHVCMHTHVKVTRGNAKATPYQKSHTKSYANT